MAKKTHGLSSHQLYSTWRMMIARCENPDSAGYLKYGARGVVIYEPWHDLATFIQDIEESIGPRPEGKTATGHPLYSLDRINRRGNYEPGNVQWATWQQQAENRDRPEHWKEL